MVAFHIRFFGFYFKCFQSVRYLHSDGYAEERAELTEAEPTGGRRPGGTVRRALRLGRPAGPGAGVGGELLAPSRARTCTTTRLSAGGAHGGQARGARGS